jgi:hypothetical protein
MLVEEGSEGKRGIRLTARLRAEKRAPGRLPLTAFLVRKA